MTVTEVVTAVKTAVLPTATIVMVYVYGLWLPLLTKFCLDCCFKKRHLSEMPFFSSLSFYINSVLAEVNINVMFVWEAVLPIVQGVTQRQWDQGALSAARDTFRVRQYIHLSMVQRSCVPRGATPRRPGSLKQPVPVLPSSSTAVAKQGAPQARPLLYTIITW